MDNREIFNDFFVRIYNRILTIEENALSDFGSRDLSVSEIHTIDAVEKQSLINENTMSDIARRLSVSAGALSVAVKTLVKKKYLIRETREQDRRRVYIFLTEKGKEAAAYHNTFHKKMIDGITEAMSRSELDMLARSLVCLGNFFETTANQ